MKTRDARAILNLKKQRNLQQKRNNVSNGRIVDARQILKLKRVAKSTKQNYKPIHGTSSLVKKQFNQILKRTVKSNTRYLVQNNKWLSRGKHVQVSTGGNLRITSRGENLKKIDASEKQILSNRTGITITAPNKFPRRKSICEEQMIEEEQDEDLERMTLDDLPEIKSMKTGVLSSKSHSSWQSANSQLSLTSRLQTPGNTMVADSVMTPTSNQQGYSILVTNLHSSVTQEDIVELFGDVGSMINAQLLQPGTALIVYFTKEEAMQACETYHNRLLDGQPMQCSLLQTNVSSVRSSLSSRLGGKLSPTSTRVSAPSSTQVSTPFSTRISTPVHQTLPAISWPSSLHNEAKTLTSNNRSVQFTVRMP